MGDAAPPTDATSPPADAQSSLRPPVYPMSPPVRCTPLAATRLTVPAAMAAQCQPWVGFGGKHERQANLHYVTASACAQALLLDPTTSTQPPPFNGIPPGMTLSGTGMTPVLFGYIQPGTNQPFIRLTAQFGAGMVSVDARTAAPAQVVERMIMGFTRVPEPAAQWVHMRHDNSDVAGMPAGSYLGVVEIPQMMPDGSFSVERRYRAATMVANANFNLATIRRRTGVPQPEGATIKQLNFGLAPVVCAAADGVVSIEYYDALRSQLLGPIQYDTGDPEIQRCSLADINGALVGIASSSRRSVAFTVDFPTSTQPGVIRPFALQPYFLPPNMAQLGTDEGPFDVALFGSVRQQPSGLVIYGRRANATSPIETSFGLFDRSLEYDTPPLAVDGFLPLQRGNDELTTAAFHPNGQVAFARYSPSTGRLEATTAICLR